MYSLYSRSRITWAYFCLCIATVAYCRWCMQRQSIIEMGLTQCHLTIAGFLFQAFRTDYSNQHQLGLLLTCPCQMQLISPSSTRYLPQPGLHGERQSRERWRLKKKSYLCQMKAFRGLIKPSFLVRLFFISSASHLTHRTALLVM